jgi:bis(5'-nucleosyl)-tetraphosphatase (symmetrical)
MTTYAIGDIQGCHTELMFLLQRLSFNPDIDTLWLCGDLVNRGPQSLQTLRWAKSLGGSVVCVLGNHDLRLLALAHGVADASPKDTLDAVLAAADCSQLIDWLLQQPFVHTGASHLMVHAGLVPQWTLDEAQQLAKAAANLLRGSGTAAAFLQNLAQRQEPLLDPTTLTSCADKLLYAVKALTTVRFCDAAGRLLLNFSAPPAQAPAGFAPWYSWAHARAPGLPVVFGHWAALGLYQSPAATCLDSGCVWGSKLTALRLHDGHIVQAPGLRAEALV